METRRLELLAELSRLGSMRAVAETLGTTTSTVSQQIAALARETDTTLIEPDGRRVRLTPAGRRLAEHAVTILAAVEAARLDLGPGAEPHGTLRVAGFGTAIRTYLLPIVTGLATTHPQVRLLIREHEPAEALHALAADETDLALTYDYNLAPATFDPSVGATPLWTTEWGLGVPPVPRCPRARPWTSSPTSARRTGSSTPGIPRTRWPSARSPRWRTSRPGCPIRPTASTWCRQ
ncbi:LysR family transcriptional regulator [Streptomyces sp. NPDC001739]